METFTQVTFVFGFFVMPLIVAFLAWRGGARWTMVLFAAPVTWALQYFGFGAAQRAADLYGWDWIIPFRPLCGIIGFVIIALIVVNSDAVRAWIKRSPLG